MCGDILGDIELIIEHSIKEFKLKIGKARQEVERELTNMNGKVRKLQKLDIKKDNLTFLQNMK